MNQDFHIINIYLLSFKAYIEVTTLSYAFLTSFCQNPSLITWIKETFVDVHTNLHHWSNLKALITVTLKTTLDISTFSWSTNSMSNAAFVNISTLEG